MLRIVYVVDVHSINGISLVFRFIPLFTSDVTAWRANQRNIRRMYHLVHALICRTDEGRTVKLSTQSSSGFDAFSFSR